MDLTFGIGSAISSIANLFGQQQAYKQDVKRDQSQFQHNKEMAEYAYSRDLEQWERANLYNAPTQQMARLREAGLNPAMIYGSGGAKTTAAQLPKYQAPRAEYKADAPNLGALNMLGMYQDFALKSAQIDNVKAQTEGKELDNAITGFNKSIKAIEHKWKTGQRVFQDAASKTWMKSTGMEQLLDTQLQALLRSNANKARDLEIKDRKKQIMQFDIDAWKNLEKIAGKELQFGLPFLRMLLGIGR